MKTRTLLAALTLVVGLLAACTDAPTATRAPERARHDGGSYGSGHVVETPDSTPARGGSYGSGH